MNIYQPVVLSDGQEKQTMASRWYEKRAKQHLSGVKTTFGFLNLTNMIEVKIRNKSFLFFYGTRLVCISYIPYFRVFNL